MKTLGSARRRLWQLPTQAHELLLATSFKPDWLRREAARILGQIHKGRCLLKGRDVDVLYSVVHDLETRNPLSEAFHKHLDARHAQAVRQLAAAKDEGAVQTAWAQARDDDRAPAALPATLWAVLTHPLGETVQTAVLYDARAWVFDHARRSVGRAVGEQQGESATQQTRQRAEDLQARLAGQQRRAAELQRQAQAEIARLQGELARQRATAQEEQARDADRDADTLRGETCKPAAAPVRECVERVPPRLEVVIPATSADAACPAVRPSPPAQPAHTSPSHASPSLHPPQGVAVAGRRVLCVGGMRHAVARYRERIERLSGRFEHHDGGIEDGIQDLESRLQRADVVICQAACINHEAYHRVKRHCERTGTPCVYLDRPSLSRLDRALACEA